MQSFPALAKCINVIANLSKKLFNVKQTENLIKTTEIATQNKQKSMDNDLKQQNMKTQTNQIKFINNHDYVSFKSQTPKIISFNSFPKIQSHPSKEFINKNIQNYHKINKFDQIHQNRKEQYKQIGVDKKWGKNCFAEKKKIQYFSNGIKKFDTEIVSKIAAGIIAPKYINKSQETGTNNYFTHKVNIDKNQKKNTKIIKKNHKQFKAQKILKINPRNHLTYEDGDDISSIQWNNETTDDLEPEFLSFVGKKHINLQMFIKKEQIIHKNINMKKKNVYQEVNVQLVDQAQNIDIVNGNLDHENENSLSESQSKDNKSPKRKRRQLISNEKNPQFRKKILLKYTSNEPEEQSQSDEQSFGGKKKHEISFIEVKSLSESDSDNEMEEEKQKQPELEIMAEENGLQDIQEPVANPPQEQRLNSERNFQDQNDPLWQQNNRTHIFHQLNY